jgi:rubrerythrin
LPPAPDELLVEAELVEAARDHEVDEVVDAKALACDDAKRIRRLCRRQGIVVASLAGKTPRSELEKICLRCGKTYKSKSKREGNCPSCRAPARREYQVKRYHQDHPDSRYRKNVATI